jgi:uncharacterized cupin superfamily protein
VIRTREGRIRPLTAFEAVPFVHSGTPPSTILAGGDRPLPRWPAAPGSWEDPGAVDARELERVPLFAGLSHREREQVARRADTIDLPAGRHLMAEGQLPHEFFVILDGEVEVTHEGEHLATLSRGDFFGEIALVEHGRRTATVVCSAPSTLAVMSPQGFDAVRRELPRVAERIEAAIKERLAR